jgi:hypothetical protein
LRDAVGGRHSAGANPSRFSSGFYGMGPGTSGVADGAISLADAAPHLCWRCLRLVVRTAELCAEQRVVQEG